MISDLTWLESVVLHGDCAWVYVCMAAAASIVPMFPENEPGALWALILACRTKNELAS